MISYNLKKHKIVPITRSLFLFGLIILDVFFLVAHILYHINGKVASPKWSITEPGGYPEIFQYVEWFTIVALLVVLSKKRHLRGLLFWAAIFVFILIDDSFEIHEYFGEFIAQQIPYNMPWGLSVQDFAEMGFLGLVAGITVVILFVLLKKENENFKIISINLLILLMMLAVFAIVIDLIHQIMQSHGIKGFGMLEDFGEMIVTSFILNYVYLLTKSTGQEGSKSFHPDSGHEKNI